MPKSNTDWSRLNSQSDVDIENAVLTDPDSFIPDAVFWDNARIVMPQCKQQITLKLDAPVIAYFKRSGKGYNTRINAVLKSFIEASEKQTS